MKKNWTKLIDLSVALALLLSRATKFLTAGAILASFGVAILPGSIRFTGTLNGKSEMHPSDLGQLTETIGNPQPRHGPGHDYGAIGDGSDPSMSLPAISPFTYTVNGFTVVRHSEFEPLTGTVNDPLLTRGPGQDFGAIGDEYNPAMSLPAICPFTYTVNGYIPWCGTPNSVR
jgi:hypothetical protein